MEKERGKLPRVDCNAVEELNAYVARQYRNDDLEYLHIYIYLVWKKESFDFR